MIINPISLEVEKARQEEMRRAAAKHNLAKQILSQTNTGKGRFDWLRSFFSSHEPAQSYMNKMHASALKGKVC